ncbi:MAG: helicase-exonuclease AddAB subunit AddA [Bacillota bacterium]
MTTQWTAQQEEAITARGTNVLVAASAGTGKTAVLVERIVRCITDPVKPVDVDRLLVVTFTNAAAAEIRARVGLAVGAALGADPENRYLARQLALLDRASITTLHSFCLELVRQYFYKLDIDGAFRIADEHEAALLRLDAVETLFEHYYTSGETGFLALVDAYGGERGDHLLQDLVLDIHRHAGAHPDPQAWLAGAAGSLSAQEMDLDDFPWMGDLKEYIALALDGALHDLRLARALASQPGGPGIYLATLAEDEALVAGIRTTLAENWESFYAACSRAAFGKIKPCRGGDVEPGLKERVQHLRNRAKELVRKLKEEYCSRSPAEAVEDLKLVAPMAGALVDVVKAFDNAYDRAKRNRNVLDFSDLEHHALRLLEETEIAGDLRERFEEVLVDEYQDINAVQERILQTVSRQQPGRRNLFMVGDVKQSIYRFRLAEPGLFLAKQADYRERPGADGRLVHLSGNFRCRAQVVDAVNFLFRQIMTARAAEMPYGAEAELVHAALYPAPPPAVDSVAGPVEVYLLNLDGGQENGAEDGEGENGPPSARELTAGQSEALLAARRIKNIVKSGVCVFDKATGDYRPAGYRDCVVLLRATSGWASVFVEEFRQQDIPVYADLGTGYFAADEVETMLSLLAVIDNPRQDIPLAGVLRSPLFRLTGEDLASIRLARENGDFYDAVHAAAGDPSLPAAAILNTFLEKLEAWRTMARRGALSDLIWNIYRDTGYYDFVGGLPAGPQRQANLRALYERAREFETTVFRGLFRFLRFIGRIRESGGDLGTARALGEDEDVVRIMSIHRAKGLEFPIVILAGLGKVFNKQDLNKGVLVHRELGLGPQVVDLASRVVYPTLARRAIRARLESEALAEEMRTLYVGLTRAREKLILIGSVADRGKAVLRWSQVAACDGWAIPDHILFSARCPLDWLVPALLRHPDCAALRRECDIGETAGRMLADPSRWSVRVLTPESLRDFRPAGAGAAETLNFIGQGRPWPGPPQHAAEIDRRLSWVYPWLPAQTIPAKLTVTEAKHAFAAGLPGDEAARPFEFDDYAFRSRPGFLVHPGALSATDVGAAVHLAMQHLDLKAVLDEEDVGRQLKDLQLRGFLTEAQLTAVDCAQLAGFFRTSLGQRMRSAERVYRELPFTMAVPASEVYPFLEGIPSEEKVLLQGVIDCVFLEEDGAVLIDYKTGRVEKDGGNGMIARYRGQLALYARALETVLGWRVKERYLYLFGRGAAGALRLEER